MSRREAVGNELNSLKAWCGELEERQNQTDWKVDKLDREVEQAKKGSYVVVEGSHRLEALYQAVVAGGKNGWGEFKNRAPGQLAKDEGLSCGGFSTRSGKEPGPR